MKDSPPPFDAEYLEAPDGDPDRIRSGILRLDYILKGGFLRMGTYLIHGPPGSGKTILGNQTCFNLIRREGVKSLYVTLMTESHAKLVRHLRPMSFFDEAAVSAHDIVYESAFSALKTGGPEGVLRQLQSSLQRQKPAVLVIDGLDAILRLHPSDQPVIEFISALMSLAQLHETTVLLCTTATRTSGSAEAAVVDGVIELSLELLGPRTMRELTVHKFRGSDFLPGKHEVEITDRGIQIHPRTEIQFGDPQGTAMEERVRMGFGVPSFDAMLHGGPLSGSATALLGAPGTGKTFLGLSFLIEGAKRGHHGIYYGFYEPPPRLIEKAESIGLSLREHVESGAIELMWQPPLELYLDALAEELLEKIRREQRPERTRLFIDGIEGFRAANPYPGRMGRFLSAFTNQLRTLDVTTLVSEELALFKSEVDMPNSELGNVVESIVLLRLLEYRSQLHRLVSVMKMRESGYDTSIRGFAITPEGVRVDDTFEAAEALLTGHARSSGVPSTSRAPERPKSTKPSAGSRKRTPSKKSKRAGAPGRRK